MRKKSIKKKGKAARFSTSNRLNHQKNRPKEHEDTNEVIHMSQLFKKSPEERRLKVQCDLKMRRKEEKLLTFDVNRKLCESSLDTKESNINYLESNKEEFEKFTDKSGKTYFKQLRKVIDDSKIVIEVLDARDPQGCRSLPIEEMILKSSKKLVLVINKADLVPKECLDAWLKYFKSQYPTLLFKSSTQKQTSNLSHAKIKNSKFNENMKTSKCIGASALMKLLKNYCRGGKPKEVFSVGVVGLPNVGKSSLINSLKRMKACNVGATPGVTKTYQEINLDSKIRIIDCPGLILPSKNDTDVQASLRNAFKIEKIKDLITPVNAILEKIGKEQLRSVYKIEDFGDIQEFLSLLALKNGRVKRGGTPDIDRAAVMVLRDWNTGKIKYFTYPPTTKVNSEVGSTLSKELNMEEIEKLNEEAFKCLRDEDNVDSELEDDSLSMSSEVQSTTHIGMPKNSSMQLTAGSNLKRFEPKPNNKIENLSSLHLEKFQKKQMKKFKKEQRRNERRTDNLADDFGNFSIFKDCND